MVAVEWVEGRAVLERGGLRPHDGYPLREGERGRGIGGREREGERVREREGGGRERGGREGGEGGREGCDRERVRVWK